MKIKNILFGALLVIFQTTASAGIVTWDIVTDFEDLAGTITFDDSPIAGLVDGDYDPNDTHIGGAILTLTSNILGINYVNNNAFFQPLTNTFDNKHIDTCWPCNVNTTNGSISLSFDPNSDSGSPALGVSEYWLYVDGVADYRWAFVDDGGVNNKSNLTVPEPSVVALFGLALISFGFSRRQKR